jgi:hypothetical protein
MEALISILQNWQFEFHVHKNASLLAIGVMLAKNPIGKNEQPLVYAFRLLKKIKQNYITLER